MTRTACAAAVCKSTGPADRGSTAAIATPSVVRQSFRGYGRETAMQSPRKTSLEILSDIWTSAGGDAAALGAVTLTGEEPQLPSSFRVAAAAQASVAATGLAAANIWKLPSG